jgi:hypothetical protein
VEYENHPFKLHGVNGAVRAPVPVLDDLQNTGGTKTLAVERLMASSFSQR